MITRVVNAVGGPVIVIGIRKDEFDQLLNSEKIIEIHNKTIDNKIVIIGVDGDQQRLEEHFLLLIARNTVHQGDKPS